MDKLFTHPLLQGVGVGLRACHYPFIESNRPGVPWFEVLSDNYLTPHTFAWQHLEKIHSHYPLTFHGVGMSLGSTDPLNQDYLKKLKTVIEHFEPLLVSEHLCWTSVEKNYFHELLPLPYTEEAVNHVADRIRKVQDFLGRRIMIENVSTYLEFTHSALTEWEFLHAVSEAADTLILLDINNIYVSAHNNGFSTNTYLKGIPSHRVAQFHLAGFEDKGTHLLDTHGSEIHAPVWELYKNALQILGPIPTVIERDNNIPEFPVLYDEVIFAKNLMDTYAATKKTTATLC